jgi:hypothetical protein
MLCLSLIAAEVARSVPVEFGNVWHRVCGETPTLILPHFVGEETP